MGMKKLILGVMSVGMAFGMSAADFNKNFCDSTLRIDYIFGGGPDGIKIMMDSQSKQAGWAGRRSRLKEVPTTGNGTVMVTDPVSDDTLYMKSFSSLFH